MISSLARISTRHWLATIVAWLILAGGVRGLAPRWDDVTYDGDLAFLPADLPSVRGERLSQQAFPDAKTKSQIVLIAERDDRPLESADLRVIDVLASRFHNRRGAVELERGNSLWARAEQKGPTGSATTAAAVKACRDEAHAAWQSALTACDEALRLDEEFAAALHNRGLALEKLGQTTEATQSRELAWTLDPSLRTHATDYQPRDAADLPLVDVWNRHHEVFGPKLRSADKQAQLVVLQLANEFMATDNIRVLGVVEREMARVREQTAAIGVPGLTLGISGSAAVVGDMLRAAAESIQHTEILTLVLVVTILLIVYRSPTLVLVPLVTIGVSLTISVGLLAALTQVHSLPGFAWWGFKIFKTTKIFIVVILFGSGTDFCLFLIARLREELATTNNVQSAIAAAAGKVQGAIAASALTTILGLAMMFFADFAKFRNSGPAIGLCLLTTLLACLTLSPALLCALGRGIFWPSRVAAAGSTPTWSQNHWRWLADRVVRRPGVVLIGSVLLLLPLVISGWSVPQRVTFDFLSELPPERPSIVGSKLLQRHFPVGEGGPVVVLVRRPDARFDDPEKEVAAQAMAAVFDLTKRLTSVTGVASVRSIAEPLGDPPEPISLITSAGRRKLVLRQHALTKSIFLAQSPPYRGEIARFELVLGDNPFSLAAIDTLARIDTALRDESHRPTSFWQGAEFAFTGTTAGIRDLRAVTHSDYWRITVLVTIAVFAVILLTLGHVGVCVYLILSVLWSYFVTIGATELYFRWLYGATFVGLDWKVPIFLFVILVAVGEDYNIYLVSRVFEEQQRLGPFAGLREAISTTGGIITSCGVIMAGSFVSMFAGSLRAISELGFALTLGILLDTLFVRTVLVPAFLAVLARWSARTLRPARPHRDRDS